jgi:hypothetical protein
MRRLKREGDRHVDNVVDRYLRMLKAQVELTEFPPAVGWYECQPEYLNVFF